MSDKSNELNIQLNDKQSIAFGYMVQGKNIFITGPGGTGKSAIIKIFKKRYNNSKIISITSTTGTSAVLLNGTTLHSYLGIGTGADTVEKLVSKITGWKWLRDRWCNLQCLIIDEISMLDPDLFDKLEYMYLSDNQLTGSIQTVNFESPDLAKVISLSNNNLTGEIPLALNEMDLSGLNIDLRYNSFTNSSSIFEYSELLKINPQTPFENTLLKHKDLDQITWVNKDLFKFKKWLSNSINLDDLYED